MSYDMGLPLGPDRPMARPDSAEYKKDFIARIKYAREASGMTQDEIADLFQMRQDTWSKYETRTPLPHIFIPKFCSIVRCDIYWLLTGKGTAPERAPNLAPHRVKRLPRARRA